MAQQGAHYRFITESDSQTFEDAVNSAVDDGYRVLDLVQPSVSGGSWMATLVERHIVRPDITDGDAAKLDRLAALSEQMIALLTRLTDKMVGP